MAAALLLVNDPDGDVPTAYAVLARTLEARGDDLDASDGDVVEALHQLLQLCQMGEGAAQWDALRALLDRVRPAVPVHLRLLVDGSQPLLAPDSALRELGTVVHRVDDDSDPVLVARLTAAAFSVDEVEGCCAALRHFVAEASEQQGAARAQALPALMSLSWQAFLTGRWEECARTSTEGLVIAEQLGYASAHWPFRLAAAALAAGRGDTDTVHSLTDEVIGWAAPRQCGSALELCRFVRSLAAVGRRDYEAAYRECTATSAAGTISPQARRSGWFALDVVESALRTGRRDAAVAHVEVLTRAGVARLSPRAAMAVDTARALTAPDDVAGRCSTGRRARREASCGPFERARVQLLHGEHLRRRRAAMEARGPLTTAHATFVRLRAKPWIDRAAAELRASGTSRSSPDGPALVLTPQEHEVAVLAAAGLTNRQIAARLDISHRTVGMHLYRVFPKLDVSTRAGLSDALASS
jgi:DNA-binding CsgD family transcriptional regulator